MRKVFVIGMGAGNPEYVTVQAINALNQVDVFFVMEKGCNKEALMRLRKETCQRYIPNRSYRIVEARAPERDRTASAYQSAVEAWYEQRANIYEKMIAEELRDYDCGVFLVWGDPALYDSTLRIIDQIIARGTLAFEEEKVFATILHDLSAAGALEGSRDKVKLAQPTVNLSPERQAAGGRQTRAAQGRVV